MPIVLLFSAIGRSHLGNPGFFVLVDGWHLLAESLIRSFGV